MLYTINKPLKILANEKGESINRQLSNDSEYEIKELVSKEIAIELLEALKIAKIKLEIITERNPTDSQIFIIDKAIREINKAITNAEK